MAPGANETLAIHLTGSASFQSVCRIDLPQGSLLAMQSFPAASGIPVERRNMSKATSGSLLDANPKTTKSKNIRRVFGALSNKITKYEPEKEIVPGITPYGLRRATHHTDYRRAPNRR
jgi:hypothetical protein